MPTVTHLIGDGELVTRDVEGCPLPTISRLYFDQSRSTVRFETRNIVPSPITVFVGNPPHELCQVTPPRSAERPAFVKQDEFFSSPSEITISRIPLGYVELACDRICRGEINRRRFVLERGRWADPQRRRFFHRRSPNASFSAQRFEPVRMLMEVFDHDIDQGQLEVPRRLVSSDPGMTKAEQNRTYILMFELNSFFGSIYAPHQ